MFGSMFIWVTRTAPYNRLTERRLRAMGHSAITVPALHVKPVANSPVTCPPDALLFTSAHGVDHYPFRWVLAQRPVFTIDEETARAAARAGYQNIRCAQEFSGLEELVKTSLKPGLSIEHVCSIQLSSDLTAVLRRAGFVAYRSAVYETREASVADLRGAVAALQNLDAIIVHSPEAARRIAEVVQQTGWNGIILCISEPCGAAFAGVPGLLVETAAHPTEEALMELVRVFAGRPARSFVPGTGLTSFAASQPPIRSLCANDNGWSVQSGEWDTPEQEPGPHDPPSPAA